MIVSKGTIHDAIQEIFGPGVTITGQRGVFGGCINQTGAVTLSNGEKVFLKENSSKYKNMFAAEAAGLLALCVDGGPKVPTPLAVHSDDERQYLLLSYIHPGRPGPGYHEAFGRAMAQLHQHPTSSEFGFETDNYIGSTMQKNPNTKSWVDFFRDHRLGFQIKLAAKQGLASSTLITKTEKLMSKLETYIDEPNRPSILHGDLWSGNAMSDNAGDAVIYDPATYYGHYEADIAMTELFGRFPDTFYAAYAEILPLDSEYQDSRKTIYALYHILNHLNIFGSSYASQAMSMVSCFV